MDIATIIRSMIRKTSQQPLFVCANCWGTQEYNGVQRDGIYDRQIAVNNRSKKRTFIERFARRYVTGIYLQHRKSRS